MGRGRLLYLSLHCHHQNDLIKMGSDENHFNVSLTVRDKVTRHCPQTTIFEERGEPKRIRTEVPLLNYQPNALPLGQTGSHGPDLLGPLVLYNRYPIYFMVMSRAPREGSSRVLERSTNKKERVKEPPWSTQRARILVGLV